MLVQVHVEMLVRVVLKTVLHNVELTAQVNVLALAERGAAVV